MLGTTEERTACARPQQTVVERPVKTSRRAPPNRGHSLLAEDPTLRNPVPMTVPLGVAVEVDALFEIEPLDTRNR